MLFPQTMTMPESTPNFQSLLMIEEISHRVLNEYTEAISTLALAAVSASDAKAVLALTSAATRLQAQAEAHRALRAPRSEGRLDLAAYVEHVCACMSKAQLAADGVRLTIEADEILLDAGCCWRVGLIVAELVRNAARHGLRRGAGMVHVEVAETLGWIRCQVFDDGIGAHEAPAGAGQRVVQALASELGGAIEWSFAPTGCCARLEFARPGGFDRSAIAFDTMSNRHEY